MENKSFANIEIKDIYKYTNNLIYNPINYNSNLNLKPLEFKPIKGYEHYIINNTGLILNTKDNKILEVFHHNDGDNYFVYLTDINNIITEEKYIHELLYQAYIGDIEDGNIIIFIDGNNKNFKFINLKQIPMVENIINNKY